MLLLLRHAGPGVGVSCSSSSSSSSRKQLQAAILLLLLATSCCAQHGKAASGSWRANSEQHAAAGAGARALAQQPTIGDDDDFDWSQQAATKQAADKAVAKPAGAAGQPGGAKAAQQQTKAPQDSSSQGPAPAADAAVAAKERSKLEADAAAPAAAAQNAGSKVEEPVQDGAPTVLGDHTAAAEQQKGPSKQRKADTTKQEAQQQEAAQGQQDTAAGTWAPAPVQQPAAKDAAVVDDVNPAGACKRWVQQYCEDVEAGAGQLADCLAEHQAAADSGEAGGSSSKEPLEPLSEDCHEEVLQLKIARSRDVGSNPKLASACAEDIGRFCNVTWFAGVNPGGVVGCLKAARAKLRPACQRQVFRLQLDAAEDYRVDEELQQACQPDAESLCQGVKHGSGQVQACLRQQRDKLSSDCDQQLFRKEAQDAGDIRLLPRLFRACLPDKKQYCGDVAPGQAMSMACLEEHLESLSEACRTEVDALIERRVRDFRLDSRLRGACAGTISQLCADLGDAAVVDTYDGAVANCLQDVRDDITDEACRAQVHRYQELASQDIRFNPSLADACFKDRTDLCAHVPPGSARVIRCLQNQRDKLSPVCRSTLMSEEVRFSENIDFQYPMKQACAKEIERFCDVVPHGGGRVIRCLQDHQQERGFSKACVAEVQRHQQESLRDIRLNHRLFRACKEDVGAVCAEACDMQTGEVCGGKVLACLSDKQEQLKSSACRKEVQYLQRMGMQDFRADMQLAEACRPDVERFCAVVEPGDGRVHTCLRQHYGQLSPACKREEVRLEGQEAENIQLSGSLLRACAAERSLFCADVQPGSARVFRCLAHNMASSDFGSGCRNALMVKLRRREANWRLDPPLRKACTADVDSLCAAEDASMQDGAVNKCMVSKADELSTGCRRELGRSLHMALFVWQPQGLLTAACDADVGRLCLSRVKEMASMPGAVLLCLSEVAEFMARNEELEESLKQPTSAAAARNQRRLLGKDLPDATGGQPGSKKLPQHQQQKKPPAAAQLPSSNSTLRHMPRLSEACYRLATLAQLPQSRTSSPDFAAAAYSLLESSLSRVQDVTGLQTLEQDSKTGEVVAVSLTGWTALAGIASLVVLLLVVATWAVRQWAGPSRDGYSVVKSGTGA